MGDPCGRELPGEGLQKVGQLTPPPIGRQTIRGGPAWGKGHSGGAFGQQTPLPNWAGSLTAVGIITTGHSGFYGIVATGFLYIQISKTKYMFQFLPIFQKS